MAERMRRRPRISMLIRVADVCFSIGKVARCQELLGEIRSYLQDRNQRLSEEDGPFGVLHALYLKLGDVEAARALTSKLKGILKADALVAAAFHQKPFWKFGGDEVHHAAEYCKRYGYEYPLAQIAELMTKEGFHLRGRCYLARIKTGSILFEGAVNMVVALLEDGKSAEALAMLKTLCSSSGTFFCYHPEEVQRLVSLLLPDHRDAAKLLLDRVRDEANEVTEFKDRFLRLTPLAGLVAPYSRADAEEMVDLVLSNPVTDLGHRGRGPKVFFNPAGLCIIYELAMVVEEHGLRWDEDRKERFRKYMAAVLREEVQIGCAA